MGGALYLYNSNSKYIYPTIINNFALQGAGVYVYMLPGQNATWETDILWGNITKNQAATAGGGIYCESGTASLASNSFSQNTALANPVTGDTSCTPACLDLMQQCSCGPPSKCQPPPTRTPPTGPGPVSPTGHPGMSSGSKIAIGILVPAGVIILVVAGVYIWKKHYSYEVLR